MTVSTQIIESPEFVGDGVITELPFNFYYDDEKHVKIYEKVGDKWIISNITYIVSRDSSISESGKVVLSSPLPLNTIVKIVRDTERLQKEEIRTHQRFFSEVLEKAYDKIVCALQEIDNLSMKLPIGNKANNEFPFPFKSGSVLSTNGSKLMWAENVGDPNDLTNVQIMNAYQSNANVLGAIDFLDETEIASHGVPKFKTARRVPDGALYHFKNPTTFPAGNNGKIPNFNAAGHTGLKRWERDNPFHIELAKYGIKSDGVSDNKADMDHIITHMKDIIGGERMQQNVALVVPDGIGAAFSSGITIDESNVRIIGASTGASLIFEDADYDLIKFNGDPAKSLYGNGIHDLNILCRGNASAGTALTIKNAINFQSSNLNILGAFKGIEFDEVSRAQLVNIALGQQAFGIRTSGTPDRAMTFKGTGKVNGTILISNFDISYNIGNAPNYSIDIQACDGLWFNNGHIHGGVLFNPAGKGTDLLASVFFGSTYFDVSNLENIIFQGASNAYRNFFFDNCYAAGGFTGIHIKDATAAEKAAFGGAPINKIKWSGGKIYGQEIRGVDVHRESVSDMGFVNTTFDTNNTTNNSLGGDIYYNGKGLKLIAPEFVSGGTSGTALKLDPVSRNCQVIGGSTLDSKAGTKVKRGHSSNTINNLKGYINKIRGANGSIVAGATSTTINSGIDIDAIEGSSHYNIQISPRSSLNGAGNIYSSGVVDPTTGNFTVRADAAPTSTVYFNWSIDLE